MKPQTVDANVVTVCAFAGFEPFVFVDDGRVVGFDVDILNGFGKFLGMPTRFVTCSKFDGVWFKPTTDQCDLAAGGISSFEERLSDGIKWSDPYHRVNRSILIAIDKADKLRVIEDFGGSSLAFVAGSAAELDSRARAPVGTRLVPTETQKQGMEMLVQGEIDGLAMGSPSNIYNRTLYPGFQLIDVHEFTQSEELRFSLNASNIGLLHALNEFINQATTTGEIQFYVDKWMAGACE